MGFNEDQLRKFVGMMDSDIEPERLAALNQARVMLHRSKPQMNLFEAMPIAFGDSGEAASLRERLATMQGELDAMRYIRQLEPRPPFGELVKEFWDRPQVKLLVVFIICALVHNAMHHEGNWTAAFVMVGTVSNVLIFVLWLERQYAEAGFLSVALKCLFIAIVETSFISAGSQHAPGLDLLGDFVAYLVGISKLSDSMLERMLGVWNSDSMMKVRRCF